jgi:type VI secretion system protein ImpH
MQSLIGREPIPDRIKLQYAGRLTNPTRNAEGLQAMIADYTGHPVAIEQFVGDWIELPEESRCRLGVSREVSTLGQTTIIGRRVWRCDHKFRIVLGPLRREDFRSLLPGLPALERLSALVRAYVGTELDWDVRLILADDASQQVQLGRGHRLGWYTRLGRSVRSQQRDEVIVHPVSHHTERSIGQAP